MKKTATLLFITTIVILINCESFTLEAPVLVSPPDNALITENPPSFIWNSVEQADLYWLQVACDENFTDLVINVSCTVDTTYMPANALASDTYYWRVLGQEGG